MQKNFNNVFVDFSIVSMGNLLWALNQNKRVWIFVEREDSFFKTIEDCNGSLCHFDNLKCVWHITKALPENCVCVRDAEEEFFKHLCEYTEDDQLKFIEKLVVCASFCNCMTCEKCQKINRLAEMYGFYDFLEMLQ